MPAMPRPFVALWRAVARGLGALAFRRRADRDVADEVDHWLAQAEAAHRGRGLSDGDARRAALREMGSVTVVRERVRTSGWEHAVESAAADVRYAARRLAGAPGFTLVAALTLALGLGAATAVFSVVESVMLRPLPYPHPERLVAIDDAGADGAPVDVTFGTFREVEARSRALEAVAVMRAWQPALTRASDASEPERIDGQRVSAGFFRALGVRPALGRDFEPADDRPGAPPLAMLADRLWRRRLAADPAAIGREITLDGRAFTVAGVMPRGFENVLAPGAEVWTPLQYDPALPRDGREWGHHLRMVGRLRPGVSAEDAARDLAGLARRPVPEFARVPWAALERGFLVTGLRHAVARGVRPLLVAVLGAVALLLAIACVNVTNLLLARGARRRGEFAVRAALGASGGRLVRQLLTESVMLALAGGALGLLVAQAGVRALVALAPPGLPRVDAIRLDAATFLFALGVTTLIGLVVGAIPALHASRHDPATGLSAGSRRTAGGHRRTRGALVVAETALALVLLVGAGLLLRSLGALLAVEPGFDPSRVLTMQIHTAGERFAEQGARRRYFAEVLEAVRRVPGVRSAALTSQLPLSGDLEAFGAQFESAATDASENDVAALRYTVTPDWFGTMRIPLRRGRLLDARDDAGAPVAVLINESLAARRFPGRDPIGQRLHLGRTDLPWFTIVGVVGDVKQSSLAAGAEDAVYVTPEQWYFEDRSMSLAVRARGDAAGLADEVRRAVWSVDADQPVVRVATMQTLVERSAGERRFALLAFEAFALAALALAAIGLYGVLAGGVAERTRELGVRAALGASPREIVALVVRQGMTLVAAGGVIGVAAALAASGALSTLLFGVSRVDPATYAGVLALLGAVSAVACALPALRAARVDPTVALRAE